MKRKHRRTLELLFAHPTGANVQWRDIEALFRELGAEVSEREGSRVAVVLFGEVRVFHRPHPSPDTDEGAVASIRKWLEQHGVEPWALGHIWWDPALTGRRSSVLAPELQ